MPRENQYTDYSKIRVLQKEVDSLLAARERMAIVALRCALDDPFCLQGIHTDTRLPSRALLDKARHVALGVYEPKGGSCLQLDAGGGGSESWPQLVGHPALEI